MKKLILYFILISSISVGIVWWLKLKYANVDGKINQIESILQVQSSMLRDTALSKHEYLKEIDSLSRSLEIQQIKGEYYIDQLGVLSDWMIFFVTGVLVVFGLVGYATFRYELDAIINKYNKQNKLNKHRFDEFERRFEVLEKINRSSVGTMFALGADIYHSINLLHSIAFRLYSVEKYISIEPYNEFRDTIISHLDDALATLKEILDKNPQNVSFIDVDYYDNIQKAYRFILTNANDPEIEDRVNEIKYKLNPLIAPEPAAIQ